MAMSNAKINKLALLMFFVGLVGTTLAGYRLYQIETFNQVILHDSKPPFNDYIFETKYAAAYSLASNGRYQDAAQLFGQLLEMDINNQKRAAVQYNLGNIFLTRGLLVHQNGAEVRDNAEYLFNQARIAYKQSLSLDNQHIDVKYNYDRVLRLLPKGSHNRDENEELGIVTESLPTGLP